MEHAENLGAYALGAVDPAEARAVGKHLAYCAECRRQLDELAEVKDALGRVPLEALLDALPDDGELLADWLSPSGPTEQPGAPGAGDLTDSS